MNYRSYEDIFPAGYPYLPDETEVRRRCRSWLAQMIEVQYLPFLSEKMAGIVNPYVREYTVSVMRGIILDEAFDPDSDMRINSLALEQLEDDFRRIVRKARADQITEELDTLEDNAAISPLPDNTAAVSGSLAANVAYLNSEVARIKQMLEQRREPALLWPTYCPGVSDDDKHDFERYLHTLCTNTSRNQTADIRQYLILKEKQHIIVRPALISDEYLLLRQFGYTRAKKTYYNS